MPDTNKEWPPLSPIVTGLRCKCPRCGEGALFKGFLTMRERCDHCGLDYDFADPADGPAFFVLMFGCVPSLIFAVWLEFAFAPPMWVHLVVTMPVVLVTCLAPLRPLKAWLVASQFYHKAREGQRQTAP
ncbi:MAG: DUF983 domain-containing protein [Acuticoccus sp.]